jgi:hypothetical protein
MKSTSRPLPLAVSGQPPLSWSIYGLHTPSKWLGTIEAATATEAIKNAAEKFQKDPQQLIAVSMI